MEQPVRRSELKTRGYLLLAGAIFGAVVWFVVGLIVAWQVWLKVLRWSWDNVRRVAGREPEDDEFDFQMLIQ